MYLQLPFPLSRYIQKLRMANNTQVGSPGIRSSIALPQPFFLMRSTVFCASKHKDSSNLDVDRFGFFGNSADPLTLQVSESYWAGVTSRYLMISGRSLLTLVRKESGILSFRIRALSNQIKRENL